MEEKKSDEKVQSIPVGQLYPFPDHPFKVVDDESMLRTLESVSQFGVIVPLIARPREEGGYEVISGHRRLRAAELAGLTEVPVIIRDLDEDAAVIAMVDSNLQREAILPSEKAWAYRMKLEAMDRKAGRPLKEKSGQVDHNFGKKTRDIIAEDAGDSARQVQRYIRLTNLIAPIIDMVDKKQMAFNPAVEISYLTIKQQEYLVTAMDYAQSTPSLSQAQRIRKLAADGKDSLDVMCAVMSEEKKDPWDKVTLHSNDLRKYFPKSYTPKQMQDTIFKLLDQWKRKRQRGHDL